MIYFDLYRSYKRRSGLTLIELMVVLTILGLSASIVTVQFAGPLQHARVDTAVEQWRNADHFARQIGRSQTVYLKLQTEASVNRLTLCDADESVIRQWSFAPTIRIACLALDNSELPKIPFPQQNGSPDYSVQFRDGSAIQTIWLAGATGHAIARKGPSS